MKQTPRITVSSRPRTASRWLPSTIAWCAHVTVVPESSRISVFMNGKSNGAMMLTPLGGHTPPIASARTGISGELGKSEASKNAQKKAAKNSTSEAMNRIMP